MKKINSLKILLCFLVLFTANLKAQNKNGTIKGNVKDNNGVPLSMANIVFKGTTYGVTTDDEGSYILTIPVGKYTIEVSSIGFITKKSSITVVNGITTKDFILESKNQELEEVVLTTHKGIDRSSQTVSKMAIKNLENPQVYNVVSKELMREQMLVSYQEALNNIPGAMTSTITGGNGGTYIKMRGSYVTTGFRDGIPVAQFAGTDPVNIETIEAIKGPSGALFGAVATYGGLVNRVTKKPYETFGGEISYSSGTNSLSRLTVDLNTPVNQSKTLLFRINGALHNENSFQDYGYKHNKTLAPSFLFKVNEKLNVTLNSEIYQSNWIGTYYPTIPSTISNIKDLPVGYKQHLMGEANESVINTFNNYIKAEYQISPNWKSTTTLTTMQNRWQPAYFYGLSLVADNTYKRTISKTENTKFNTTNIQQNFNGTVNFGKIKNTILFGLDYYNYKAKFLNYGNSKEYDLIELPSANIPLMTPAKIDSLYTDTPLIASVSEYETFSAYGTDVISLTDRLNVLLSLRIDRFFNKPTINNGVENKTNEYAQTSYSPKLGLTYQLIKDQVSLFSSYSDGFVNKGPVTQPDGSISIFKPEHAIQFEAGVKAEAFNKKLSGSVSYYNLLVDNKVRRDDITNFQIQDGAQRISGVELDLFANPIKGLNIIAGYSYIKAVNEKIEATLKDKIPSTIPKNIANLWISYKLENGLGFGFGGNYVGENFGNATNTFVLPEYTVLNSSVFYDYENFRFGLKVNNLNDTKYWDINFYPQISRQLVGNIAYHF